MKKVGFAFVSLVLVAFLSACAVSTSQPPLKMEAKEASASAGIILAAKWKAENSVRSTTILLEKDGREVETINLSLEKSFAMRDVLRSTMGSYGCITYLLIDEPGKYVVRFEFRSGAGTAVSRKMIAISKSSEGNLGYEEFHDR